MQVNTELDCHKLFVTLVFLTILTGNLFGQNYGEVSVKKWGDDKKSAVSFSFDDSFVSQYLYARPVLNQNGFKGTFYVESEDVDDPGIEIGTWDNWREVSNEGHEIGSHTVTHAHLKNLSPGNINTPGTLRYEMFYSRLRIEQEIPGQKCITIAYPFAEFNSTVRDIAKEFYESARADGSDPNDSSPTSNEFFTLTAAEELFNLPRNSPSADNDEYLAFQNSVNNSVEEEKWLILMAHEVIPFSILYKYIEKNDWYPMTQEWLNQVCTLVKGKSDNGDVWVETVANVTRYIKERDSFTFNVISSTGTEININITDPLDNTIYNYPLTSDILIPGDWTEVNFSQGNRNEVLTAFTSGGKNYVRAKVIPDGGNIRLLNQPANSYKLSGTVAYNNIHLSPLKNVAVNLTGPGNINLSSSTNANGEYNFTGLQPGSYQVSFSKTEGWSGVNSTDALEILRYFTNQAIFDSLQVVAADVNNSSAVNATDALGILSRFTGSINNFQISDWLFDTPTVHVVISNNDVIRNIKAIAAGDVNKSLIPVN